MPFGPNRDKEPTTRQGDQHERDSQIKAVPSVSVVIPTYREAENLPSLIARLKELRTVGGMDLELLIMDDDSRDGTREFIEGLGEEWVRLFIRTSERGLGPAVCDGLKSAHGDVIVVMDADLSHPPECIPALVEALGAGHDFALGSRYVEGGSTAKDWGFFRRLNSRVATLLAKPFTDAKDPMSGFFALRRSACEQAAHCLNPIGYKIGLELIVKCECERVKEIPFHFCDRKAGESKLTLAEQARYVRHIRRLFIYKYGAWANLAQFLAVGALGVIVNLATLTLLMDFGLGIKFSIAAAIAVSMAFNFVLNRRFTFSHARNGSVTKQFFGYIGACSLGALLNYFVACGLSRQFPSLCPQLAAAGGIIAGVGANFLFNQFAVFKTEKATEEERAVV